MEQSTVTLISSVAAGAVPVIVAVISGVTPNLLGRKLKARQQEIELEAKRYESIDKAVALAKKFDTEFEMKIDLSNLKKDLRMLIDSKHERQLRDFARLERFLARSMIRSAVQIQIPSIREPSFEASQMRRIKQIFSVLWIAGAFLLVTASPLEPLYIALHLPKSAPVWISVESLVLGYLTTLSVRGVAQRAKDKLRRMLES